MYAAIYHKNILLDADEFIHHWFFWKVNDNFNFLHIITHSQDFHENVNCIILELHQWLLLGTYISYGYSEITLVSGEAVLPKN